MLKLLCKKLVLVHFKQAEVNLIWFLRAFTSRVTQQPLSRSKQFQETLLRLKDEKYTYDIFKVFGLFFTLPLLTERFLIHYLKNSTVAPWQRH